MEAELSRRVQAELGRTKGDLEVSLRAEQEKLMEASRQMCVWAHAGCVVVRAFRCRASLARERSWLGRGVGVLGARVGAAKSPSLRRRDLAAE